jgi:hypothetical protein
MVRDETYKQDEEISFPQMAVACNSFNFLGSWCNIFCLTDGFLINQRKNKFGQ